jgi:hypothetical protein
VSETYEIVLNNTKKIETLLEERLGAEGRGLYEKSESVEELLEEEIIKKIRRIATIRNKLMHEDGFKLSNTTQFEDYSKDVIYYLSTTQFNNSAKQKPSKLKNSKSFNRAECLSCGSKSIPKLYIKPGSLLFREKKRHICSVCGTDIYTTGGGGSYIMTFGVLFFLLSQQLSLLVMRGNIDSFEEISNMYYLVIISLICLSAWRYRSYPSGTPWFQTFTIFTSFISLASWGEGFGFFYSTLLTIISISMILWLWKYKTLQV